MGGIYLLIFIASHWKLANFKSRKMFGTFEKDKVKQTKKMVQHINFDCECMYASMRLLSIQYFSHHLDWRKREDFWEISFFQSNSSGFFVPLFSLFSFPFWIALNVLNNQFQKKIFNSQFRFNVPHSYSNSTLANVDCASFSTKWIN